MAYRSISIRQLAELAPTGWYIVDAIRTVYMREDGHWFRHMSVRNGVQGGTYFNSRELAAVCLERNRQD